ncbi:MAG: hypothetical protein MTP17_04010 [Candidatus Midichloria sp.]|nr:MAG: hypothetical protein MTP17_04010 [Candidatus Midichloria sp.]
MAQKVVTDEGNTILRDNTVRRFFKECKHNQDTVYHPQVNMAHLQAVVGEDRKEMNKALQKAKDQSAKKKMIH